MSEIGECQQPPVPQSEPALVPPDNKLTGVPRRALLKAAGISFGALVSINKPLLVLADNNEPMSTGNFEGIEIQGIKGFIQKTIEALNALSQTKIYPQIKQYIANIRQGAWSGMDVFANKPTFNVGDATWQHSEAWYAGAIAHDSNHSKLYFNAKQQRDGAEPKHEEWTGTEAERHCLDVQQEVLKNLKADHYLIDYIEMLKANPTYHIQPLSQRNW